MMVSIALKLWDDSKTHITSVYRFEDAKRLYDGMRARQQEVLDYCMRMYEGSLSGGGSCVYAPASEYAVKCSQVVDYSNQ